MAYRKTRKTSYARKPAARRKTGYSGGASYKPKARRKTTTRSKPREQVVKLQLVHVMQPAAPTLGMTDTGGIGMMSPTKTKTSKL